MANYLDSSVGEPNYSFQKHMKLFSVPIILDLLLQKKCRNKNGVKPGSSASDTKLENGEVGELAKNIVITQVAPSAYINLDPAPDSTSQISHQK